MVRLSILFLSILVASFFSHCQTPETNRASCDCSSVKVQDSLVAHYMDNGAYKYGYNDAKWGVYCDSLIAVCPNIASAYQHKALPHIKYGNYAVAFPLEDKAAELDPLKYLSYRAFLKCIFTKDYEGALVDFEKSQALIPNGFVMDHSYFFYMGICHMELKQYAEAEANFKQDHSIQSKTAGDSWIHFNSHLYRGILHYRMNKKDEAKKYFLKSMDQYAQLAETNYYMGLISKEEGKNSLAKQYLQVAKNSIVKGYGFNEDNVLYTNYPGQIKLFEIDQAMKELEH